MSKVTIKMPADVWTIFTSTGRRLHVDADHQVEVDEGTQDHVDLMAQGGKVVFNERDRAERLRQRDDNKATAAANAAAEQLATQVSAAQSEVDKAQAAFDAEQDPEKKKALGAALDKVKDVLQGLLDSGNA